MLTKTHIFVTTILLGVSSPLSVRTVALAETPEQRQACIGDAFQFCQSAIPDRSRVFSCLVGNKDLISAACRTVISPYEPIDLRSQNVSKNKGSLNISPH
jgi:hypothetical protein